MTKTYKFHVNGMHCSSCVVLTESELAEVPEVSKVKASLKDLSVEVTGEFGDKTAEHVANDLSEVMKPHGYSLVLERQKHHAKWSDFRMAVPVAVGFVVLFIVLQKLGIVNLISAERVSFGTAFFIGLIASVSTCMAVVGGLVLSMSANFAKKGDPTSPLLRQGFEGRARLRRASKYQPMMFFHVGRLVSFFVLGGVIGALGSAFQLGTIGTFALGIIVGLVMLMLGVNLLDVFPWAKRLQPTMPGVIGKRVHNLKNVNHSLTPLLLGVATFFLPCGFTQSMQIYTLTTGSFLTGAMMMFMFAIGTLPVLALISFSSLSIHSKAQSGVFFKAAGLIVIFFAIFNIINSLVVIGWIPAVFNF